MNRLRAVARGERGEAGGYGLEILVIAPLLLLFILFLVACGRSASASSKVDAAAASAARAASQQHDAVAANQAGTAQAQTALADAGVRCADDVSINIDTSAFDAPAGQTGSVIVQIKCSVDLSDLAAPLIPGSVRLTGRAASPIDLFREGAGHR